MKKVLFIFVLLFTVSSLMAGEESCPADLASDAGYNPFGDFHHILAPTWHGAYPEKDYDALLAAGPKFLEIFKKIEAMKPEFKNEVKKDAFYNNREKFAVIIKDYAKACEAGDKEKAYELMPQLHDSFEMTAAALLPIHYPMMEGFILSVNMLMENHIKFNNKEGIVGTTETLVIKSGGLTEESIPEELKGNKDEILTYFGTIKKIVAEMDSCCKNDDMEGAKAKAKTLSDTVDEFTKKFI